MLELMDTAALCNWSQRPFFSNQGNLPVTSYTQVAKLTASFHTEYSLKFLAPAIVKVKVIVKVLVFVLVEGQGTGTCHTGAVRDYLFTQLLF